MLLLTRSSVLLLVLKCVAGSRRILCLHGRGGSADAFLARAIAPLRDASKATYYPVRRAKAWEYDALDSPDEDGSGSWWSYPAGQRSYSADSYTGAEESIAAVEAALATGEFCGLLGYSQGAMLAAVVAARAALGEADPEATAHLRFAVICSAALPAPYRPLLERLRANSSTTLPSSTLPTLHCLSQSDQMNPPELGEELAGCFGASAQLLWHDAGHKLPPRERLKEVAAWLDQTDH